MTTQTPSPEETSVKTKKRQNQPRHHAGKSRAASSARRKKIIKGVIEGKPLKQIGIEVGLSPKTADSQISKILHEPQVKNAFLEAMQEIGIDDEYLVKKHMALLEGKRHLPVRGDMAESPDAPGYIEVPDNIALARGLDIAHKLAGRYTDKVELDTKQPVEIVIRKFCSRGQKLPDSGQEGATT